MSPIRCWRRMRTSTCLSYCGRASIRFPPDDYEQSVRLAFSQEACGVEQSVFRATGEKTARQPDPICKIDYRTDLIRLVCGLIGVTLTSRCVVIRSNQAKFQFKKAGRGAPPGGVEASRPFGMGRLTSAPEGGESSGLCCSLPKTRSSHSITGYMLRHWLTPVY